MSRFAHLRQSLAALEDAALLARIVTDIEAQRQNRSDPWLSLCRDFAEAEAQKRGGDLLERALEEVKRRRDARIAEQRAASPEGGRATEASEEL